MDFYNDEWEDFIKNCGFTDTEKEIIKLLRRGWFQVDIAEELYISQSTVKRKIKSIKSKIQHYVLKK